MQRSSLANLTLTIGLATVFALFGLDKFWNPLLWVSWVPQWMDGLLGLDINAWLSFIGAFEILCAIFLVIPVHRFRKVGVSLIIVQLLVILPLAGFTDTGIRDFGLLMSAVALWLML